MRNKATFLQVINNTIILSFSENLLTTKRRLTGWQFLAVDITPTFLNTGSTDETFQQSGKQVSFGHIFKGSASMYENSGSQFFRTTTTIQLGPDAFDKLGLVTVMTFLTNLLQKLENYLQKLQKYYAVTAMLCSFRLVPERNLIHQDQSSQKRFQQGCSSIIFLVLANNFALSGVKDNTFGPLSRGGIADLPLQGFH